MNITTKKYGITIWQASFNENGRCSSIQLWFQEITYIDSLTATTASVIDNVNLNFEKVMNSINIDFGSGSYSYTTKDACTSRSYTTKSVVDSLNYTNKTKEVVDRVDVAWIDKLGTDSVDNNAYIEATNWTDLWLTISSTVGPGWIIGGNYIVQW